MTISANKKTVLTFQFLYNPEYVTKDSYIIINENNLKTFGRIIDVMHDTDDKFGLCEMKHTKKKAIVKHRGTNSQEKKKRFEVEVDTP